MISAHQSYSWCSFMINGWIPAVFIVSIAKKVFGQILRLAQHSKTQHKQNKLHIEQASFEHLICNRLRWHMESPGLPEGSPRYRQVFVWRIRGCKYIASNQNSLISHVSGSHLELTALQNDANSFWSMLMYAKGHREFVWAKDIFDVRHALRCRECLECIGSDRTVVKQHINLTHPGSNVDCHIERIINLTVRPR